VDPACRLLEREDGLGFPGDCQGIAARTSQLPVGQCLFSGVGKRNKRRSAESYVPTLALNDDALNPASSPGTGSRAKKTAHASEQDRPDVLRRRQSWFDAQPDLAPERLVFIDETWAKTNMARTHGRARRGERLRVGVPHGHWKTTTVVAALTLRGMIGPFVLSGPINRDAFEAYVERVLDPNSGRATSWSWTTSRATSGQKSAP
jgi:DDE superfamily endonuclease